MTRQTKITQSAFGGLNQKSAAIMSETSKPCPRSIDKSIGKHVDEARAAARERFKHLAYVADGAPAPVDPENPTMADQDLAGLRPAYDVCPQVVAHSLRRRAGRPKQAVTKTAISMRLDPEVIDALRARGAGWQTRANELLRSALDLGSKGVREDEMDGTAGDPEDAAWLEHNGPVLTRALAGDPVTPDEVKRMAEVVQRHIEASLLAKTRA